MSSLCQNADLLCSCLWCLNYIVCLSYICGPPRLVVHFANIANLTKWCDGRSFGAVWQFLISNCPIHLEKGKDELLYEWTLFVRWGLLVLMRSMMVMIARHSGKLLLCIGCHFAAAIKALWLQPVNWHRSKLTDSVCGSMHRLRLSGRKANCNVHSHPLAFYARPCRFMMGALWIELAPVSTNCLLIEPRERVYSIRAVVPSHSISSTLLVDFNFHFDWFL